MKMIEDLDAVIHKLRRYPTPQDIKDCDEINRLTLEASSVVRPIFQLLELSRSINASFLLVGKYLPKTTQSGYRGWLQGDNIDHSYNSIHRERHKLIKKLQTLKAELEKLDREPPEPENKAETSVQDDQAA